MTPVEKEVSIEQLASITSTEARAIMGQIRHRVKVIVC